jgi:hemoglobin
MRWAVDNVMAYSAQDAVVPAGMPMPRWDWDGLKNAS